MPSISGRETDTARGFDLSVVESADAVEPYFGELLRLLALTPEAAAAANLPPPPHVCVYIYTHTHTHTHTHMYIYIYI